MSPDDAPSSGNSRPAGSGDAFDDILDDLVKNSGTAAAEKKSGSGPDTDNAQAESPKENERALTKVELDIDDAPFLEDEEEKEPDPGPGPAAESLPLAETAPEPEEPTGFKKILSSLARDKKRLGAAVAVILVLLLSPLAYVFFSGQEKPPEPPVAAQPALPERQLPPPPKPAQRYVFEGAPYLVEHRGSEGELRFLKVRFTIATNSEPLFRELQHNNIILRDAVYHYLSNKPLSFLSDKQQIDVLRTDLISVINDHVTADKITELYFEEYLITGK